MNVARSLVEVLARAGVRHVYGIPGDAINSLIEAIRQQDQVKFIQVRHEEAGALAASAEAKLTGQLAVCVGTAGPGAIHLLNGLYDAKKDHAPVLAISGQVERGNLRRGGHQEIDLEALFADVSDVSATIVHEEQMPRVAEEAVRTAALRRSVAHLSLPEDIASRPVEAELSRTPVPGGLSETIPEPAKIDLAVDLLNRTERPVILAGIGALEARDPLLETAARLQAPIIKTLRAKELIPDDHPLSLGGLGLLGTRPALDAIENCTTLLMVGTDFPYDDYYPDHDRVIQIDMEPSRLGRRHALQLGLLGHARPTLQAILPGLEARAEGPFLRQLQASMHKWRESLTGLHRDSSVPLRPQRVAHEVGEAAPDDAIFLCDTGSVTVWGARHLNLRGTQRFTLSGNLATMGFALPGAIGAQLAYPDRRVVALAGDGGFSMLMADFATAVKYQLPIVVVIFNNGKLGLIQMEQEVQGYPEHETGLEPIDFGAFARQCGGVGMRVERPDELGTALAQAFTDRRPTLLDVQVVADEKTMPPRIEWKQAVNFGVAKVREMLGQGDTG